MKAKVTPQGLIIPKEMLLNINAVEILQEYDRIVIIPLPDSDPITELGQNPVDLLVTDASTNHDAYLYL